MRGAAASSHRTRMCAPALRALALTSPTTAISAPASGGSEMPKCTRAPTTTSCRFHQIRAASNEVGDWGDAGHAWIPIDDETTMVYNWVYTRKSAPLSDEDRLERSIGNGPQHVDQTTFRSKANCDNAYLIDRAVQKTETFTGIDGINVQ